MQSYVYEGPRSEIINFCKDSVAPGSVALMYETSGIESRLFIRALDEYPISLICQHFILTRGNPSVILDDRGKWCKMGSYESMEWFPWSVRLHFSNQK